MATHTSVEQLMNLGPTSSQWLREVGIHTIEQLRSAGSVEAFIRVKHAGFPASLNLLWAIEAGLQKVHFTKLSDVDKRLLMADLAIADPSFMHRAKR